MATISKNPKRARIFKIAFIGALLLFIIFSFITFMRDNSVRIMEQNNRFIEAGAVQTAERIDDLIAQSRNTAEMMAHLYGATMTEPTVSAGILQDMTERSLFDYVEFISPDGMDHTADGRTADVADREYFQQGMLGNSGTCVVYNSRITDETLLIFYTPFYHEEEIIGVLSGILRSDTMLDLLSVDYFGVQANTYLLEPNANVILSAKDKERPDNLLDSLKKNRRLSDVDQRKLEQALENQESASFNYQGSSGAGSAYITALKNVEWSLVQTFPSALTKKMLITADSAGILLEIRLFAVFLLYILYLLLRNRAQKRQLVSEKQEVIRIVGAVTQLFTRFALVNYEDDTYEYLESKRDGVSIKGSFSELLRNQAPKYIDEEEPGKMGRVISRDYVQEHLTEDVPYLQFEYQIELDGRHWENLSILCLKRENGRPAHVLYAIQDVTALKEQEQQIRLALKNASEAAEAANRAKSDFLARMSHDIRTPMNAIMGMTAVAAMHLDDKERLTDCLSKITVSSRHLLALINDVLDMSKIESGKVTLSEEPFSMADMVDSIVTIIRSQTNSRHQELKVHISDIAHENVIGDTLRLRQVFVNILGNAVKFTPENGTITFSIRERDSLVHGMACYEFVCRDTGIGMEADFIKTIFDPFSRSENSVSRNIEGTGLGMSITRNIVRMMEGDIQVESQPGQGSVFTVQLHLKLQDQAEENTDEFKDLRVLVADDDPDACVSACEILEGIGMNAEWVLNGKEAVARTMEAHAEQKDYAVVILDWKMPEQDGVETAREIRRQVGDSVPIIVLSAYDWSDIEAQAREAGIQVFIEKPLFRSRLIYALRSVFAQKSNEQPLETAELENASYAGKRILLVEDNELNREIAEELLSFIGVLTEEAENGQIAVEMAEKSPQGYYDLILMDIQMPVMNGYEATRRIRGLGREDTDRIPIIAMTANAFADDIREALDAGMNDHVAKPVEVAKLLEMLDKWLQ